MKSNLADLEFLRDRLADAAARSIIDRRHSLDQVPQARSYLEEGHAGGKIVIQVAQ